MKTSLFLTFCVSILLCHFAQAQIVFQSFEGQPADNWNFTESPTTYNDEGDLLVSGSNDVWAAIEEFTNNINDPSDGDIFWGGQDLENSNGGGAFAHTLTFDPVNISAYTGVQISFDYYTSGYDSPDSVYYQVFYDGIGQGLVDLDRSTLAWTPVSHSVVGTPTNVHVVVYARQNGGSDYIGWDHFRVTGTSTASCPAPSSLMANNVTTTTADLSWTIGNAARDTTIISIVPTGMPAGSGTNILAGSPYNATGLATSTMYDFYVREVCTIGDSSTWAGPVSFTTLTPCLITPDTASSALNFSGTTINATTLNWTSGNGTSRIVIAREGSAVTAVPSNSSTYTADANFGAGQNLGSNQFVVYNGNGNMLNLTGLATGTTYHFAIFEYNCTAGAELYFSTAATANETTVTIPKIAVTEFIVSPTGGLEWVEIYNYGTTPVDLNGWTIEDEGIDNAAIASSSITIPAGGFKILTTNKTSFETEWLGGTPNSDVIEVTGAMALANGADEIVIKDNLGTTVWAVAYPNDDSPGNATFLTYTETIGNVVVWGNTSTPGIDRGGIDLASGTLGYESNNNTTDVAAYASTQNNMASPLLNNLSLALHVDMNATGSNDGSSWANAFTSLQDAIDVANAGALILVAQGTYLPSKDASGATSTGRDATFYINKNISIEGGYPTGGGAQNPLQNQTILSGDLGIMSDASDNAYHVVWMTNLDNTAKLAGVYIQDGNANDPAYPNDRGAGIFNDGSNSGNSSPTLQNCIIRWNMATTMGGGLLNFANHNGTTSPMLSGCLFYENSSAQGASMANSTYTGGSNATIITNSTFTDNVGASSIYNKHGNATITLQNSIVWETGGNPIANIGIETTLKYTLINRAAVGPKMIDGGNNIYNINPEFIDAANDNYALKAISVAIENGSNALLPSGYDKDLQGANRAISTVDLGVIEAVAASRLYVNIGASGGNTGLDWANAYTSLKSATDAALAGTEIWVATGTYYPTTGTDRSNSFQIRDEVKLYGGFAGGEANLNQRDWAANTTILSGDIGTTSDASDNSYHVINLKNVTTNTWIDGVTIEHGNSDGSFPNDRGAGIYNDGANSQSSNPTLQNCIIRWNNAATMGGGILNFANNGGTTSPIITGCLFYENTSTQGASLANSTYVGGSNSTVVTNSTFADNTGASSIYNPHGNATITIQNSILWDDNAIYNYANETTVQYSSVKGASLAAGTTDGGNNQLAMNPLFVDATNDDYSLQAASPAIAAGNNTYVSAAYTLDLAHNTREIGTTVEMGCYEDGANLSRSALVQNDDATSTNTASEEQTLAGLEEEMDASSVEVATAATMSVYPNPVQSIVHINLKDANQQATVRLLSTTGQVLIQEQVQADAQTVLQLNMGRLAKGMYLLNIQLEDGTQLNQRVVKF